MTTTSTPTRRADSATQATGTSEAARPEATSPIPKKSAALIAKSVARRVSMGRSPVAVRTVGSKGGADLPGRRVVDRVDDDVEVPRRHVGPAGLERRQDHPERDGSQHEARR